MLLFTSTRKTTKSPDKDVVWVVYTLNGTEDSITPKNMTGLVVSVVAYRFNLVIVERSNLDDKLQPRNINVSFNNNSNVPIDVMIFIFCSDELVIDVETGIIQKIIFL